MAEFLRRLFESFPLEPGTDSFFLRHLDITGCLNTVECSSVGKSVPVSLHRPNHSGLPQSFRFCHYLWLCFRPTSEGKQWACGSFHTTLQLGARFGSG